MTVRQVKQNYDFNLTSKTHNTSYRSPELRTVGTWKSRVSISQQVIKEY